MVPPPVGAEEKGKKDPEGPVIVRVLLPLPLGDGYDYLLSSPLSAPKGSFVRVPLGRKTDVIGIVWGEGEGGIPLHKMRPVAEVLDVAPLPADSRRFVDWVAGYTLAHRGAVLKMVFGGAFRPLKAKDRIEEAPLPCGCAPPPPVLTAEQQAAASALVRMVDGGFSGVTLLDGVTGSGKTEVYGAAIARALERGKQVLLLLPEIAMTVALAARLEKLLGVAPVLWHSALTERQRRLNWHAIANGAARFILGARSALFLPFKNLGLIVADEEHEGSYKQEEGVIYHGRDMAVVRGHLGGVPVILASATPSLETLYNVDKGKYGHVVLKKRFGEAVLPDIRLVDLRAEKMPAQSFISDPLMESLEQTLGSGQQAMLFLNRRGYAPLTLCRACGYRLACPSCTSWMIEHKRTGRLHCHQCGHNIAPPEVCPVCGAADRFAACGPGVERIAEEVAARLPAARVAIMASDTVADMAAARSLIERVESHEVDLLIGTQMMAKGYHFPLLTTVGVIDADLGLAGGDPRAAERTFQLLQQVAGRSGRADARGRVYVQTANPDHPVMRALAHGARDAFMKAEMRERQDHRLPPFGRLASITLVGADREHVAAAARALAAAAPQGKGLRVLGPAPAPFALLRGKLRYRLMVQAGREGQLSGVIGSWLARVRVPRAVRVQVDIDPYSFL